MNKQEKAFFRIADGYTRERHACFLTEMFLNQEGSMYFLCFRPLTTREGADRFACVYYEVAPVEVKEVSSLGVLPELLRNTLDQRLTSLVSNHPRLNASC
jgi:hypothetical protein